MNSILVKAADVFPNQSAEMLPPSRSRYRRIWKRSFRGLNVIPEAQTIRLSPANSSSTGGNLVYDNPHPGTHKGASVVKRLATTVMTIGAVIAAPLVIERIAAQQSARWSSRSATAPLARITIDYPEDESIFPPEMTAPTFLWRDTTGSAVEWLIEVRFADGSHGVRVRSTGPRFRIGELDPRAVGPTNELPKLTPEQAAERSWTPEAGVWATIKRHSVRGPATVTITGFLEKDARRAVSSGQIRIQTAKEPAGAPIFYRDVPLMPSELEKGVIKPLAASALPLIAWRLRSLGEPRSRLLVEGLPTCANCHSFSRDGKTLGMDLDGPQNDKGLYVIARIAPQTVIRNEDVITWSSFREQPAGQMRVGFMSQISPDGQYVVTTVGGTTGDLSRNYYVANFKDYRFLQVFYATRGILAWYDRATGRRQALAGADDPRCVQTNAVWSPDGKYLVFARAEARDAYPEGLKMAEFANHPNETRIQYDLYRIPFNEGRGGRAEPIAGASRNGMSNAFAKVSPDGRWIVFVQCRNGLLMRPDSQLYIVPAEGGQARRMRCNTPLMNSWHSFSPNGRWLVFSSKNRSPYTQMYLTHVDGEGRDTPPILIENATAANRAVNIPEFVNVPAGGLLKIEVPATEFYRLFDVACKLAQEGQYLAAIAEWNRALKLSPSDAKAHNNLGFALVKVGRIEEAISHWQAALQDNSEYADAHKNLGRALLQKGDFDQASAHWRKALEIDAEDIEARHKLGYALLRKGRLDEAIQQLQKASAADPKDSEAQYNLGLALLQKGRLDEAIAHYQAALAVAPKNAQAHNDLAVALLQKGQPDEAIAQFQKAIELDPKNAQAVCNLGNAFHLQGRIPEALAQWRLGLQLEPNQAVVLNQAAWVLATSAEASIREGAEALKLALRAVELTRGREPAMLDTLAAAYAETGRFADATQTARRALALAMEQNQASLAERIKARIALYQKSMPFRLPP